MFLLILAIIVRILFNCQANVIQKSLAIQGCNPLSINAITYTILALISLILVFVSGIGLISFQFLYYALLVGLLGALGNGFLVKALEKGELSVLGPLNAYKAVIALLFAMIFLSERPGITGILGMFLVIAGSCFVFDSVKEKGSTLLSVLGNRQIQYRFIALVFSATEAVFIKKVIILSSVYTAFLAWCIFGAFFAILLLKLNNLSIRREFGIIKTKNVVKFTAIVFCVGIMQYTTNFIFTKMNVAYALSLFQLSALVSVVFGYKFFKEKNIKKKFAGALIMILGSVLIILYN